MTNFKRKKKLIDKSLQLKMITIFTAIGCTCALFQVVLVNNGLLQIARSAPSGGDIILKEARGMMLQNTAWTLGAMIPLMTCIGIVLTHRVAGPAYRMKQHCLAIAAGEPVKKCSIREHDELQDLCNALNAAIEHLAPATDESEGYTEKWDLEEAPTLLAAPSSDEAQENAASDTTATNEETAA